MEAKALLVANALRYTYTEQGEAIMNIQPNQRMSKAAFIGWGATEERYELVGGRVIMMPRPSLAHGLIVGNLYVALRSRLDRCRLRQSNTVFLNVFERDHEVVPTIFRVCAIIGFH
jgi:hypothetical protein